MTIKTQNQTAVVTKHHALSMYALFKSTEIHFVRLLPELQAFRFQNKIGRSRSLKYKHERQKMS